MGGTINSLHKTFLLVMISITTYVVANMMLDMWESSVSLLICFLAASYAPITNFRHYPKPLLAFFFLVMTFAVSLNCAVKLSSWWPIILCIAGIAVYLFVMRGIRHCGDEQFCSRREKGLIMFILALASISVLGLYTGAWWQLLTTSGLLTAVFLTVNAVLTNESLGASAAVMFWIGVFITVCGGFWTGWLLEVWLLTSVITILFSGYLWRVEVSALLRGDDGKIFFQLG